MQEALPKTGALPGAVCAQRVRCGKSGCKCARGEPHVAYYRFWREGGRLRKVYVRAAEVEETRASCARWRECARVTRAMLRCPEAAEQRRRIRLMLRQAGVGFAAPRFYVRGVRTEKGRAPNQERGPFELP